MRSVGLLLSNELHVRSCRGAGASASLPASLPSGPVAGPSIGLPPELPDPDDEAPDSPPPGPPSERSPPSGDDVKSPRRAVQPIDAATAGTKKKGKEERIEAMIPSVARFARRKQGFRGGRGAAPTFTPPGALGAPAL